MAATASAPTHRPPPPPPPPGPDHPPCPRCESQETKFCYYNNYNLAQPRYFCKACRRYWTLGGTLRNIPVGGTTRKAAEPAASVTKRRRTRPAPASSASSTSTSSPSSPSAANPPPAAASEEHLGATGMPADVAGTFGQLMMEPLPLLREPFLGSSRLGFGLGLGLGLGGIEELGFGLGRAGWSFLGADDGGLMVGADAWQVPGTVTGPGDDAVAGGDAAADAGAFLPPWPDLTISSRRIQ